LAPKTFRHELTSELASLSRVEVLVDKAAGLMGFSEDERDNLAIALTEAAGNAIVHGNKLNPDKKIVILFRVKDKKTLEVSVRDQGSGFNPDALMDPTRPENLLKESGRGIFILKTLMDDVRFDFSKSGTTLSFTIRKKS